MFWQYDAPIAELCPCRHHQVSWWLNHDLCTVQIPLHLLPTNWWLCCTSRLHTPCIPKLYNVLDSADVPCQYWKLQAQVSLNLEDDAAITDIILSMKEYAMQLASIRKYTTVPKTQEAGRLVSVFKQTAFLYLSAQTFKENRLYCNILPHTCICEVGFAITEDAPLQPRKKSLEGRKGWQRIRRHVCC